MVCLENLMYRCRYPTDTSVWINCILHFCKGKREWKWCPGASFSLFGSKQISVWQTSICLKPTSQTIHCICLCLTIVLYPTHDICLHVCSAPWDTKPGLLCRLDSTTRPRYAVSSEPCRRQAFWLHQLWQGFLWGRQPVTRRSLGQLIYRDTSSGTREESRLPALSVTRLLLTQTN